MHRGRLTLPIALATAVAAAEAAVLLLRPRDGDPRAAWLLLDTSTWTARYRRTPYDVAGAQAAIRAARLPNSLAERLEYGQ